MLILTEEAWQIWRQLNIICIRLNFMLRDSLHIPDLIPNLWFITGFVTRLRRRVPLVEQELLTLPNHLSSPPGSCYSIFSFICMFCRSLFVLLSFFFWPLCCLFFFDLRILIAPLVSSNSSYSFFLYKSYFPYEG
jgi:hypothetical protein